MACLDAETVAALFAGELSRGDRDGVEDHVDRCASCRQWIANAARDKVARETERPVSTGADTLPAGDSDRVALAPGAKVGRYIVRDLLGAGGMGVVYEAHDPQLDRSIALKVVRAGADAKADVRAARFVREAQAMARVSHPNVVPIYDAGHSDGLVFIAMKRIDGASLRERMRGEPAKQRLRWLRDAGRGLAAAHAAGIVHRDFKPDNVLVDADGTAQVGDFGLAALSADDLDTPSNPTTPASSDRFRTSAGAVLGTPAYMAPEVKRGERADARSDQYSFAVTIDEVLGPAKPRRVQRVLARARAEDPDDRFAAIDPVLRALEPRSAAPWIAGGVLALAATAVVVWPTASHGSGAACEAAATQKIEASFSPATRAAIATKLAQLPRLHPKDAEAAVARVERFAADWLALRRETCRASASGELSAELADLRMACLDERLDALGIVTRTLATLREDRGESALRVAGVLSGVESCANPAGLRARAAIGPIGIASTRALRTKIFEAHTHLQLGDYARAMTMFDEVLAEARRTGNASVEAEAILSRAVVLAETKQPGAVEGFHEARAIAERIGDRELRVDALIALLADASVDPARASEIDLLVKLIESALVELPGDQTSRRGRIAGNLTNYHASRRDWPAAERSAEEARQAFTKLLGPVHPYTLMARSTQAHVQSTQGRQDRALAITREVLGELRGTYGERHPLVAQSRISEGVYLAHAQHNAEAAAAFRDALAITEEVYGRDHVRVADVLRKIGFHDLERDPPGARVAFERAIAIHEQVKSRPTDLAPLLVGLGESQLLAGDAKQAVATLERAFALWGESRVALYLRPTAKFVLARALWDTGGDRARARKLAAEARDEFLANGGPWRPSADKVDRWLSTHR